MIYCVVPQPLAGELYDRLADHYRDDPNVKVIVDRRSGEDRRAGEDRRRERRDREGRRRDLRDRRQRRAMGSFAPIDPPG